MKTSKFTHLAPAPYTVVDYEYKEHGSGCDHCGTFIKHVFTVEGANGVKFQLGSSHVQEVGGAELSAQAKRTRKEVENRAYFEQRRTEQAQATANRIEQIKAEYSNAKEKLAQQPHPNSYFASQGKTMIDYLDYFRADTSKSIEEQDDDWWIYGKVRQIL